MEKIRIKSSKGYLSAVVHRPQEVSDKLAILCPGFLDSKDYRHLVVLAEILAKKGYEVVRFDPTGTWESSGDISEYDTTQYLDDVKTVVDYMDSNKKYEHILIGGHSRGGRIAILYAAHDPRISTVLGIMPSHGSFEGRDRSEWESAGIKISKRDLPENKDEFREFRLPFSHALDLDKYDTLAEAEKIKVPVILIAGEFDDMVTPDDVREIVGSLKCDKRFIVIPDIGHNYRKNEEEIKIVNDIIIEQLNISG